jgi:hypothetical protein
MAWARVYEKSRRLWEMLAHGQEQYGDAWMPFWWIN